MRVFDRRVGAVGWLLGGIREGIARLYYRWYRSSVRLRCFLADHWSVVPKSETAIPPALPRFRVSEQTSVAAFLAVGERTADDLRSALERIGRPLGSFASVLDFGCGCGRTIRWLRGEPTGLLHGCDVDSESVAWCQAHLSEIEFRVNELSPPTVWRDEQFDLIYAISVFTHLDRKSHVAWLAEFARISKREAVILITLHGRATWGQLSAVERGLLERGEMVFQESSKLRGLVPAGYHTAFHSESFLACLLAPHFELIAYVENGFGYQDCALLRRVERGSLSTGR